MIAKTTKHLTEKHCIFLLIIHFGCICSIIIDFCELKMHTNQKRNAFTVKKHIAISIQLDRTRQKIRIVHIYICGVRT